VLGLAAHFDDDGVVPVVFFSTDIDGIAEVSLSGYSGRIAELNDAYGHMGRTNYAAAMEAVVEHYRGSGSTAPAFVVFQTDGGPSSRAAATEALCRAARMPLFWQFVGFGEDEFRFLRRMDELPVPSARVVDNAGFFAAGPEPRSIPDGELYDLLTAEFPEWLASARELGIVAR
jgi:hypothetical protein